MDEIKIEQLQVYAYHGVLPEENRQGQRFLINATLLCDLRKAGRDDNLVLSTHYGEVCEFITRYMTDNMYQLIEAVAENLGRELLLQFENIKEIILEIQKPQAPIPLPFGNVSVKIQRKWHRVYIAFGSNMGDRKAHISRGIDLLKNNKDIRLLHVSDFFRTKPYGGVEQEDFLNGVLEVDTLLYPEELLKLLHEIEEAEERERVVHWGPRTLDLDILFYDKEIYESNHLIIPHIDMENRDFVLKPLVQLIPNFRHPVLQKTMEQLLDELMMKTKGDSLCIETIQNK